MFWLLGPEARDELRKAHSVGAIGIEMAISPVVGWLLGSGLDAYFGTGKTLGYAGLAVGFAAGFRALFRVAVRARRDLDQQDALARGGDEPR